MSWLTFAAIAGAVAIGIAAYARFGQTGGTLRDALAVLRSGFFILVGIGLVAGGFVVVGVIVIALFVFLGAGAALQVREEMLRQGIAPD